MTTNQSQQDPEAHAHDPEMPLTEHLEELRRRILISGLWIGVVFFILMWVESYFKQPILGLFRRPLDLRNIPLVFDELTEPFMVYVRVAFYASLFLTFPLILGQLWQFIKPALYPQERRYFWPFLLTSYPLFIGGGLFGYFLAIPVGYDFFLSFQNETTFPSLRMGDYLTLTLQILFGFGLVFEMPVVTFFLVKAGVIDAQWLKDNRRFAIVGVFIVAAILTPPDVFSQLLMAIPLLILYEISILVAGVTSPRSHPVAQSPAPSAPSKKT